MSNHYVYIDHSNQGKIVFECSANNILQADALYLDKTGLDVSKQCHIGCYTKKG